MRAFFHGHSRTGAALHIAAASIAVGAIAWAGLNFRASSVAPAPAYSLVPMQMEPLLDLELASALTRVGLDAPSLAAAGLASAEVTALVGNARTHLEAQIQSLRDADAAYAAAKATYEALERRVQSGQGSPADVANLATAATSLSSAVSSRRSLEDGLFAAATQGLASAKIAALATLRSHRGWEVPVQYRAAGRDEAAWVALRTALANQRIAAERGEPAHPNAQQIILAAQAEPAIASAITGLQSLGSVQDAWNAATQP